MLELDIQRISDLDLAPEDEELRAWAAAALPATSGRVQLALRLVDEVESRELNHRYRHQDRATNVLSFPAELEPGLSGVLRDAGEPVPLGDVVICVPVMYREAAEQGKTLRQHWAHLVIHGVLHLLGHEHETPAGAQRMEALETELLQGFGFGDPYRPG
jgi:probable rRNA maturation factor